MLAAQHSNVPRASFTFQILLCRADRVYIEFANSLILSRSLVVMTNLLFTIQDIMGLKAMPTVAGVGTPKKQRPTHQVRIRYQRGIVNTEKLNN